MVSFYFYTVPLLLPYLPRFDAQHIKYCYGVLRLLLCWTCARRPLRWNTYIACHATVSLFLPLIFAFPLPYVLRGWLCVAARWIWADFWRPPCCCSILHAIHCFAICAYTPPFPHISPCGTLCPYFGRHAVTVPLLDPLLLCSTFILRVSVLLYACAWHSVYCPHSQPHSVHVSSSPNFALYPSIVPFYSSSGWGGRNRLRKGSGFLPTFSYAIAPFSKFFAHVSHLDVLPCLPALSPPPPHVYSSPVSGGRRGS